MKILQITGYKDSGKTTVINRMLESLKADGCTVAVIKHHHDDSVVMDNRADSESFTRSGADYSILNTPGMSMKVKREAPDLKKQLAQLEDEGIDCVLIEGYKALLYPKIFLSHSFRHGHTNVDNIGLQNVLKTFDVRYDGERIMEWFKEWSSDI
ncbi:MAG TPA: molybdopterin-guanine dinucleotide biosynthesis protein B [Candidatus Salinicoccus stercoripullorum]|uniref:Molybdopterin-guanine dinucleotide biosynthesis protein B n=1 Tax=Candidatus Salinicoccus stercoripullorum TaxID=2838756 RepID=A0A9D1QG46_9STAP|nr:molybdopterin-guanine dinucleotide biosynthesis protein B [Candidatus Salinicoccus stercoripullorum]